MHLGLLRGADDPADVDAAADQFGVEVGQDAFDVGRLADPSMVSW